MVVSSVLVWPCSGDEWLCRKNNLAFFVFMMYLFYLLSAKKKDYEYQMEEKKGFVFT